MGLLRKSTAVGLEMDSGVIRAVQLKQKGKGFALTGVGRVDIPDGVVSGGVVEDVEAAADALRRLWTSGHFSRRDVVLGVSNQGLMMRTVTFPKVPEEKLGQALRLQAGDYFPIAVSELVMDFSVLRETDNGELEVLLVGVRKEHLQCSLDALAESGLTPRVVDAAPLALMRAVPDSEIDGTVMLVDISNGLSTLLVVSEGVPVFARSLPVTLRSYAEDRGIALEDLFAAEDEGDLGILRSWSATVSTEVNSSIDYFMSQNGGDGIDALVMGGRGSRVPGLKDMLEDELETDVHLLQPLEGIALPRTTAVDLESEGPDFSVSTGLALRGLEEV